MSIVIYTMKLFLCMTKLQIKKQPLPPKFTREFFALITTMFFTWLLGPSEVHFSIVYA